VIGENILTVINSLVNVIELRDMYTQGHSRRVALYAQQIAIASGMNSQQAERLYFAGLLHDVGKISIPDAVLLKPGKLSVEEYEIVKLHSVISAEIVSKMGNFEDLVTLVRHHHEQPCGKGYPDGLHAEEIPLGSRILAVADVFDSLSSERVYRKALSLKTVQHIMQEEAKKGKLDLEITTFSLDILVQMGNIVTPNEFDFPELEHKRKAFFYQDTLTGLGNRDALILLLRQASATPLPTTLVHLDVLQFREYNKKRGPSAGDDLLQAIGEQLGQLTSQKWSTQLLENQIYAFRTIADAFCLFYCGYSTDYNLQKIYKLIGKIEMDYAIQFETTLILEHTKLSPNIEFDIGYLF